MLRAELEINGIGYRKTAVVGQATYSTSKENNYNNIVNAKD